MFYLRDTGWVISFNKCVGNYYDHTIIDLIKIHSLFELGVMPFDGTPMDQPCKIMDVFDVIAEYKSDKLKKELDKQKAKNKAAAKGVTRGR